MATSTLNALLVTTLLAALAATGCSKDPEEATTSTVVTEVQASEGMPAEEPQAAAPAQQFEVLVFGSAQETRDWLVSENWWGADWQSENLAAPHVLITGLTQRWRTEAQAMPIADKKQAFFRFMLPLILHANQMVMDRRARLEAARDALAAGEPLDEATLEELRTSAARLKVAQEDEVATLDAASPAWADLVDALLYRVDIVPAGLALGQAAYESGWGTSRFAQEGNSLFGQWTYGGQGIKPEQQRAQLGDHRIAAFDWPFDSVRGYYINLMSHPAYEDFRRLRAQRRAAGETLDSLHMADGLLRYSERGQEYVDGLKGIIRSNHFDAADTAVFREEPLRFYVGAESPEDAEQLRAEIARMREAGELKEIYERMRLD